MTLTVEQNLLVFTYLYRVPRGERRAALDGRPGVVDEVLAAGNARATTAAGETMAKVRDAMQLN